MRWVMIRGILMVRRQPLLGCSPNIAAEHCGLVESSSDIVHLRATCGWASFTDPVEIVTYIICRVERIKNVPAHMKHLWNLCLCRWA